MANTTSFLLPTWGTHGDPIRARWRASTWHPPWCSIIPRFQTWWSTSGRRQWKHSETDCGELMYVDVLMLGMIAERDRTYRTYRTWHGFCLQFGSLRCVFPRSECHRKKMKKVNRSSHGRVCGPLVATEFLLHHLLKQKKSRPRGPARQVGPSEDESAFQGLQATGKMLGESGGLSSLKHNMLFFFNKHLVESPSPCPSFFPSFPSFFPWFLLDYLDYYFSIEFHEVLWWRWDL